MAVRTQFDWSGVGADPQFREFQQRRARFLLLLCVFSGVFFFALPVGAAYLPEIFALRVYGAINVGLLVALAQFLAAGAVAWLYTRRANHEFDPAAEKLFFLALDRYRKR